VEEDRDYISGLVVDWLDCEMTSVDTSSEVLGVASYFEVWEDCDVRVRDGEAWWEVLLRGER
jgi:hypothetical protein